MKYLILILVLFAAPVAAQDLPAVLSEEDLLRLVAEHHPLAVRADLQRDRARAVLREARGGFDPKLYGDLSQKYFKGTRYYSLAEGGLKVPTWFGVELNAAYERNGGYYLNPENTVPDEGLFAAGLSVSLGQGLFFDQRRAELQRARIYQRATGAERLLQINELLYEAGSRYWEWAGAQGAVSVYTEAVELARARYAAVVSSAALGDRPAIDTLEARILVQNRLLGLESARLEAANAAAALNAFLWLDGVIPLELEASTRPPDPAAVVIAPLMPLSAGLTNPALTLTRLKLEDLEVDERLQLEQLKPRLDLKYNALISGSAVQPLENYSANDYKWGISFSQSLLLRKERGKLQLTRIKLSETQLELSDKIAQLNAKVEQAENEANVTVAQYALATRNVSDYSRLLAGERELFQAGESSLFLVNSREVAFIDASLKQLELMVKHRKAGLARNFAAGQTAPPLVGGVVPNE
ncbi:TolC family protein [Neolewinella litorea]|uniref:TolC family protein n=1 Tax=Neolewinella litorea TaxID=2562452 RepID=UPI001455EC0D|nr:TolC family protein [Neolewinella litorea]